MAIDDNALYGLKGSQIKELPGKIEAVKGQAKVLTTADYNYPTNNPNGVALWKLAPGCYVPGDSSVSFYYNSSTRLAGANILCLVGSNVGDRCPILKISNSLSTSYLYNTGSESGGGFVYKPFVGVVNNLTSTDTDSALSAAQGKVLKDLIDAITSFSYEVVQTLPASGQNGKIYLVPIDESGGPSDNYYEEYIWVNNAWEMIGTTEMDLTNYVQFSALATVATSGNYTDLSNTPTVPSVVQTTGASTTDVMSQNAVTDLIYTDDTYYKQIAIGTGAQTGDASSGNAYSVAIGTSANAGIQAGSSDASAIATAIGCGAAARGKYGTAIGAYSKAARDGALKADGCVSLGSYAYSQGTAIALGGGTGKNSSTTPNIAKASYAAADGAIAIGVGAVVNSNSGHKGSIALGAGATVLNKNGVMSIGTYDTSYGYSSSFYRLLTGLYDGQSAHDAATVGQAVGTTETYTIATSDWTALSASSPYDYQATVTATYTIGANTIAELLNDSPVDFATHGFAIGSISSQSVTLYSIGQPSASQTLKINYKG